MKSGDQKFLTELMSLHAMGDITPDNYERMKSYFTDIAYINNPIDSAIWKSTGNFFFKQKDYQNALKCYETAVEIDNRNTDALNNIAVTYRVIGRMEDARLITDYLKEQESQRLETHNEAELLSPVRSPTPVLATVPDEPFGRRNIYAGVAPPYSSSPSKERKRPGLALVLAIFFGGAGQVYNGHLVKGLALFFCQIGGALFFIIPGLVVWVYAVYDAYSTSNRMNLGHIPFKKASLMDWIIYVVVAVGIVTGMLIFFVVLVSGLPSAIGHVLPGTAPH
jgi:tetratricopeptide (TPR) repeat protein